MSSRFDQVARRHFITTDDIRTASLRGDAALAVPDNSTVTDEARELAMRLGLRLDVPGQMRPAAPAPRTTTSAVSASAVAGAPAGAAMKTLPEDTSHRVADAIASVLGDLKLGERAAQLAPVLTRRVFAGLAKAAERK